MKTFAVLSILALSTLTAHAKQTYGIGQDHLPQDAAAKANDDAQNHCGVAVGHNFTFDIVSLQLTYVPATANALDSFVAVIMLDCKPEPKQEPKR